MSGYKAGNVEPYEAKDVQWVGVTDTTKSAIQDVMTAVNGFPYAGDRADAVLATIGWLRTRPDVCAALGFAQVSGAGTDTNQTQPLGRES